MLTNCISASLHFAQKKEFYMTILRIIPRSTKAGDMGHYKEQLMEVLVGLLGNASEKESRKMIEDALEDLRA